MHPTHTDCEALYDNCIWDAAPTMSMTDDISWAPVGGHLDAALQRLRLEIPELAMRSLENADIKVPQQVVSAYLDAHHWKSHFQQSPAADRVCYGI